MHCASRVSLCFKVSVTDLGLLLFVLGGRGPCLLSGRLALPLSGSSFSDWLPVSRQASLSQTSPSRSDRFQSDRLPVISPAIRLRPAPDRPAPDRPAPDRPAPQTGSRVRPAPDRPAPDRPAPDRPAPQTGSRQTGSRQTGSRQTGSRQTGSLSSTRHPHIRPAPASQTGSRQTGSTSDRPAPDRPAPDRPVPCSQTGLDRPAPDRPAPFADRLQTDRLQSDWLLFLRQTTVSRLGYRDSRTPLKTSHSVIDLLRLPASCTRRATDL